MPFVFPSSDWSCVSLIFGWLTGVGWPVVAAVSAMLAATLAVLWWREYLCRRALMRAYGEMPQGRQCMHSPAELQVAINQLRKDAQLAQQVFESSPDSILVMDPANEKEPMAIVICSENACVWHGWKRDELIGRSVNLLEVDPTHWTPANAAKYVVRLREAGLVLGEAKHRRRDGSAFPVEFTNSLIVLDGREYVLGFDRDITVRRAAEAALRASEERFHAIIDACPLGIWLLDPHDPTVPRRIVEANEHAARMHGVKLADMVGRSVNDFDTGRMSYEDAQASIKRARNNPSLLHGEGLHRRADGTEFPIQYISTRLVIGGRELILGIDQDITERKQAEAALRASEERFRAMFNASPAGMLLQDPHDREVPLRIVDANQHAADIHGVRVDDMIGRSIGDFQATPVTYEIAQARLGRMRSSPSSHGETIHRRADGQEFPIEYAGKLLVLNGREFILGVDLDITERKRIDTELSESRRLRAVGAMVGGIAHEFNNLLTPMLLHTEMLIGENENNVKLAANIGPIRVGIDRARELTQRILTFGRRTVESREFINLEEVVRDNIDFFARTIDRRIQVAIHPSGGRMLVWANRSDLNQLVVNLILNARDTLLEKAGTTAPAGWVPRIDIFLESVTRASGARDATDRHTPRCWRRLTVRDNGLGMSDAVRERVFEPFFTTKGVGQGTGLGLATAWHVSTTSGGWVEIESRQGEGAAFNVFLPAADDNAVVSSGAGGEVAAPEIAPAAPALATRLRVLLVEDSEHVACATQRVIESCGYEVQVEADGQAAWMELSRHPGRYDVVFSDLNLPGISGMELVRRVRGIGYKGRVIVYSGYFSSEHAAELAALGVDHLLPKPFHRAELVRVLE